MTKLVDTPFNRILINIPCILSRDNGIGKIVNYTLQPKGNYLEIIFDIHWDNGEKSFVSFPDGCKNIEVISIPAKIDDYDQSIKFQYYTTYIAKDSKGQWWGFDTKPSLIIGGWGYHGDSPDKLNKCESPDGWEQSLKKVR